jgi:antitoxin ParD1/3/4
VNVSLTPELEQLVSQKVSSGMYQTASEVVREALRIWREKQIEKDLAALERAHAGAHERDTTPEEMASILRIQKSVRAKMTRETRK